QRQLGPAIQERNELLVSIRTDIDITPQLGRHVHANFLKEPPSTNVNKYSLILPSKHQSEEQILRGNPANITIIVSNTPLVEVSSIRRQKFVSPYPSPNIKEAKSPVEGIPNDNLRENKPKVEQDTKRIVPEGIKQE
ncbi:2471_t:CDS:2, partial [Acaulospora colombiana]